VDNTQCQLPIENITFKLKRDSDAKAQSHKMKIPDLTLATNTYPGVDAGGKKDMEHMMLDLNNARESNRYQLKKQRKAGKKPYEEEDLAVY
jgi:hypothetical protein